MTKRVCMHKTVNIQRHGIIRQREQQERHEISQNVKLRRWLRDILFGSFSSGISNKRKYAE